MRVVLTGGKTGGHFYPLLAVAEATYAAAEAGNLTSYPEFYYLAPEPYDSDELYKYDIVFKRVAVGKRGVGFSFSDLFSHINTIIGIFQAVVHLFSIYPDVIFSKGGFVSFPILVAAQILRIPVMIHESDAVPGRTTIWASKFAKRVAVSYPQAAEKLPKKKTAVTSNPVRKEVANPAMSGAREYLGIPSDVPVIFVIGGSQGSQTINTEILEMMPRVLEDYCVIHQTGKNNIENVRQTTDIIFSNLPREKSHLKKRYKPFGFLDETALRMASGAADIVISRAGSTIFEIAAWAVPSILIPLEIAHADHQTKNAYSYARTGAATVIEEANLSDDILLAEINKIVNNDDTYEAMAEAAASFYNPNAAKTIAEELITISRKHS